MSKVWNLGILAATFAVAFLLAGCSHAVFPQTGGTTTNGNSTVILTLHDTPPSPPVGVAITSFEVTVTGAVLQPGNISIVASPQTVELTQLQTNSIFLSTTQVPAGTYSSVTLTYANPSFTFMNDTGVSLTVGGQVCAANASCVVSLPTIDNVNGTATFTSPVVVTQTNQTLIEADVNLNSVIQPTLDLDFSQSASAIVNQTPNNGTLGTFTMAGQVTSVAASSNQFQLTPTTGTSVTITVNGNTDFEFARDNCSANDFTCVTQGQVVGVAINIQTDGSFNAGEVDFDDAPGTQQVSGTIVSQDTVPPTTLVIVVHNTIPPVPNLPPGTPVTVTIGSGASYVVNNGSFVLPAGLTFSSTSDVIIGQEMEARVASNSSISNGAFTADRLALEQTQLEAAAISVNSSAQPPQPSFTLTPLPALFTLSSISPVNQIFALTVNQGASTVTSFQNLAPLDITGVTTGQLLNTGGFLFNTSGTVGSPSIVATVVRGVPSN